MSNEFIVKFRPFDKVEKYRTCAVSFDSVERIVQLVAFDNVTSTLLLVWTGLNTAPPHVNILLQCDFNSAVTGRVRRLYDRQAN